MKRVPYLREAYYSETGQRLIEAPRWHLLRSRATKEAWRRRTQVLLECEDNACIPRVPNAGRIVEGCLIMHNGLLVRPDSYYNYAAMRMMQRNRGVHEPQEERAFQEVLRWMPSNATMVELGAYWGFYSMWFHRAVAHGRTVLVEPMLENLQIGRENFRLNGLEGTFVHAFVGGATIENGSLGAATVTVDRLVRDCALEFIHLLHADIQGQELEMLYGSSDAIASGRVGWTFISTHSDDLHEGCLEWLRARGFVVVAEHDRDESYSGDGLIVARHPTCPGPDAIPISLRRNS